MNIELRLFGGFQLIINGKDETPTGKEREFFALLVALAGKEATAKNYWEIVEKPKHLAYNAAQYSSRRRLLNKYLRTFQAEGILMNVNWPVRSCKIDLTKVSCDYYQMLDGTVPLWDRNHFLPEYPWASDLFQETWDD